MTLTLNDDLCQNIRPQVWRKTTFSFFAKTGGVILNIFCKLNNSSAAKSMFEAEEEGLKAIDKTKTVKTPIVYAVNALEKGACLLMEYVASKNPESKDLEMFGVQLAAMHQTSSDFYGWDNPNFIGNLLQSNHKHPNWVSFYVKERLDSQLQTAVRRGFLTKEEVPSIDKLQSVISSYCTGIKPSLLHGDLWSGNYLISENGEPYLIDPAVYFGHSEIDLSMSRLFGGFSSSFYAAYFEKVKDCGCFGDFLKLTSDFL
mgnify:CR=1 FL=1